MWLINKLWVIWYYNQVVLKKELVCGIAGDDHSILIDMDS